MNHKLKKTILPMIIIVVAALYQWLVPNDAVSKQSHSAGGGEQSLMQAYQDKRSKVWVEVDGSVKKVLPDDNKGSRHQRFILRLGNGHTVLVAHNIDLADKVPLSKGDALSIRGRFEYNDRGGVLHWTHRDTKGNIKGGWISHKGKKYL